MPSKPLPPEKQAEIEDLERAIREAVDAEVAELAANLATTDDAHLFGANEFKIGALAHRIAAKAIEQHLARKKLGWQSFLDQSIFKLLKIRRRVAAEPPALGPDRLTTLQSGTQLTPGARVRRHQGLAPHLPAQPRRQRRRESYRPAHH